MFFKIKFLSNSKIIKTSVTSNEYKFVIKLFLLLLLIVVPIVESLAGDNNGHVDATEHNFDNGSLELAGEWQFFWNQLCSEQQTGCSPNSSLINVPGSWHCQGNYPLLGYATYRLQVKLPPNSSLLSISFPVINSAYKIWINNKLCTEVGVLDVDRKLYVPKLQKTILQLPDTTVISIIVQVVNYTYFSSGIVRAPIIDKTSRLIKKTSNARGIENFLAGSLVAMFIYQFVLFLIYQRGRAYLWLSLICLIVALRSIITHGGSFLLPDLFPIVPVEIWKKIEFSGVYALGAIIALYIYNLFTPKAQLFPVKLLVVLSSLLCILVATTPQFIYGKFLDVAHVLILLSLGYAIYSITTAWRLGDKDARILFFAVITSLPFIVIEILSNSVLVKYEIEFDSSFKFLLPYCAELSLLLFLLFQVYLLANQYEKSYVRLEQNNSELEKRVTERTDELIKANVVKEKILSVLSHDIKGPLSSLNSLLKLYNMHELTNEECKLFMKNIEDDLNNTLFLVDNILLWSKSKLKGLSRSVERFDLADIVESNIQLFRSSSQKKGIHFFYEVPSQIIFWDTQILNIVLRNTISNAIKFSHDNGIIRVSVENVHDGICILIEDKGVGMSDEIIKRLFSSSQSVTTRGTNGEAGTGLGIRLCREFLELAGGRLTILSEVGVGSVFKVYLPVTVHESASYQ